jgi:hypothetical protein
VKKGKKEEKNATGCGGRDNEVSSEIRRKYSPKRNQR